VQLMVLGMILQPIFVLGTDMSWVVFLYVFAMILIATHESLSRQKYRYNYNALVTFFTFFTSISAVGSFAFLLVIRPEPYWNPQYVIPICGMLMGNCINGVSLAVKTFSTQLNEGGQREIELCLSFGATGWESVERLAKEAISIGVTPMINSLNVIGLISIPGMMTGQILGGSPVTEAAHYQILIIYLISTCTFLTIFMNIYAMYRVAFDTGTHMFRVDRFVKVEKKKLSQFQRFKIAWAIVKIYAKKALGWSLGAVCMKVNLCLKASMCCFKVCWKRRQHLDEEVSDLERQSLSGNSGIASLKYDSSSENTVQILSKRDTEAPESSVVFRISNLQISVPESLGEKKGSSTKLSSSDHPSSMPPSPVISHNQSETLFNTHVEEKCILCTNLHATLTKGGIGIVRGPSGSGKSTLMRVLSGLTEADSGYAFVSGSVDNLLLSDCKNGSTRKDMVHWRSEVRYVTQYKVDIPGTPRDFMDRINRFRSYSTHVDKDLHSSTIKYLTDWGMETSTVDPASFKTENEHNPFLDKEWKSLSGGESQRMLLAIALSTKPRIILLDECTSGLDIRMEQQVENSLVDYVKESGAAILWVTHSEDIANRLLK